VSEPGDHDDAGASSGAGSGTGSGGASGADGADGAARRRRAEVFGDVLPDATSDERGEDWGEHPSDPDEWYRREVPPHHT